MVAPKYGPTESSPLPNSAVQDNAALASGNAGADADADADTKRRRQILDKLLQQAAELRLQGNQAFKKAQLDQAEVKYSQAIHMLQKIPRDMAAPDLVKSLNNRSRVYVKLDKMEQAEIDASEVLSMNSVETAATSAAFFVRYHARTGLGAPEDALGDLKRSAGLGNPDAKRLLHSLTKKAKASSSTSSNPSAAVAAPAVAGGYDISRQARWPPATTARAAAATTAAARRRARGATAAASAKKNGAERERLRARLGARAGEELSFGGGGANEDSPYGRRPVGGSDAGSDGEKKEEEGRTAEPLEIPGKRRPRSRPAGSPSSGGGRGGGGGKGGGKVASISPHTPAATNSDNNNNGNNGGNSGGAVAATEESDTFPPPHPALAHPSVRQCLLPPGGRAVPAVTRADDSLGEVAAGSTAAGRGRCEGQGVAAPRGEGGGEPRSCGGGGGKREVAVGDGATGEARNGRSSSGREGSGGACAGVDGGDEGGGHGADEEAVAVRVVAPSEGVIAAPPPARQAQLVRWLVAQAKDEKHCREGEIWAVLDKNWWDRWQLYAGCSEDDAGAPAVDASGESDVVKAGPVEQDAPAAASSAGSTDAAAEETADDAADDVAGTAAAKAETKCTPDADDGGDSTAAEEGPTAGPHSVPVGGDGGSGGGKSGGGASVKAVGEAQTSGDPNAKAAPAAGATTNEATALRGSPAPHPGPIDNSELVLGLGTPGTIPGTGRRLQLRLVRGYHFVLVPQEAWIALHAWYGGGPALPRALVSVRDSDSGDVVFEPQLYPEFSRLDPVLGSSGGDGGYADGSASYDAALDTPAGDDVALPPAAERKEGGESEARGRGRRRGEGGGGGGGGEQTKGGGGGGGGGDGGAPVRGVRVARGEKV
eukprot:g6199.t2